MSIRRGHRRAAIWGMLLGLFVALAAGPGSGGLPIWKALVLGAVEGLTEYLPVSSTGHLLVAGRLLDLGDATDGSPLGTYVVAVQVGAIAAVLGLYRERIRSLAAVAVGGAAAVRPLAIALFVGFLPAGIAGALLAPTIKEHLFRPWPIVAAWAIGGLVLLVWTPSPRSDGTQLLGISVRQAGIIGIAQVLAVWPGTSRSLATLLAGLGVGLTIAAAVELTFLLGVVTLTAATVWDLARNGSELVEAFGWVSPVAGAIAALLTAFASVRWMTAYLEHSSLRVFGTYRLGLASVVGLLLVAGLL